MLRKRILMDSALQLAPCARVAIEMARSRDRLEGSRDRLECGKGCLAGSINRLAARTRDGAPSECNMAQRKRLLAQPDFHLGGLVDESTAADFHLDGRESRMDTAGIELGAHENYIAPFAGLVEHCGGALSRTEKLLAH